MKPNKQTVAARQTERREFKSAVQSRIRLIAHERKLSESEIARALTCHTLKVIEFGKKHGLDFDWLIAGDLKGMLRMVQGKTAAHRARPVRGVIPMTSDEIAAWYERLTPEQQQVVSAKVQELLARQLTEPSPA